MTTFKQTCHMLTCHMLMAEPSTYDMFALIQLLGKQITECLVIFMIKSKTLPGGNLSNQSLRKIIGDEQTIKHAQTVSEDPNQREQNS